MKPLMPQSSVLYKNTPHYYYYRQRLCT